jgi:serine/threonine-protein kinase
MPAPAPVERNLLFGLLALQVGLVTREQLLDAVTSWIADKARPLGEALVERGLLRPHQLALLDGLVEDHLDRQGRAALPIESEAQRDLARIEDEDVQRTLGTATASLHPAGPGPRAAVTARSRTMRYRKMREHARGGLGEVFIARDEELDREVALKEMQAGHADQPEGRARFVREAELTGKLEHPGVVPVYGLGYYADGRPYYAMRFIRGQSLDEAILHFHRADAGRRDPGERALALRGLLRRFVDVCNAVAYAHARDVIHRDLKPANVMLGEYGETLVVDWGLAKVIDGPEEHTTAERPLTTSAGSSTPTQLGQAVGTPGYMPPEQARGQREGEGPACDVFALGATLYCLLTGRPPYQGRDVLARAAEGRWSPARQVNPRVPRALEAVCAKAMAQDPGQRYRTARALAGDVERWLADEPVSAYRDPLSQRLRRWGRRHRPLVAGALTLLVAGVVGLAAGLWAVGREQARTAAALHEAEANLERAVEAEGQALANLKLSEANFALARKAVDDCFGVAKNHPLLQAPHLRQVRELLFQKALPFYQKFRVQRPNDPRVQDELISHHYRIADIQTELGNPGEALRNYRQAEQICRRLTNRDPASPYYKHRLAGALNNISTLEKKAGRYPQARTPLVEALALARELVRAGQGAENRDLLATVLTNLGVLEHRLGNRDQAIRNYWEAAEQDRLALQARPTDPKFLNGLGTTLADLGSVYEELGQHTDAIAALAEAAARRRRLVQVRPGESLYQHALALTLNNLANAQKTAGHNEQARESYQEAAAVARQLLRVDALPNHRALLALVLSNLGAVKMSFGDRKSAEKDLTAARDLRRELVKAFPDEFPRQQDLAVTLVNLGMVQAQQGDRTGALTHLKEACALLRPAVKAKPGLPEGTHHLAGALSNLGSVQLGQKDHAGARASLDEALELGRRLVRSWPRVPMYRNTLAAVATNLGNTHRELGETEQALRAFAEAIDLRRELVQGWPEVLEYEEKLAGSLYNLGAVQTDARRWPEALKSFTESVELRRRFVRDRPTVPDLRLYLLRSLHGRAQAHAKLRQLAGSLQDLDEAMAVLAGLQKADPRHPRLPYWLFTTSTTRASILMALGKYRQALPDWDRVVALVPSQTRGVVQAKRALCLAHAGEHDRAAAEAMQLSSAAGLPASVAHDCACVLALSAAGAERDRARPLALRERQAEQRAGAAVALLVRLARGGFFGNPANVASLDGDPDLAFLRGRDDYQRFRTALANKETALPGGPTA